MIDSRAKVLKPIVKRFKTQWKKILTGHTALCKSSCTALVVAMIDIEEMIGNSRGKTRSLSISRDETSDGGGIGMILRKVPGN